ncbi:reverse transcriptase domain-containing protein [Tanacetum coccineum]
MRTRSSSNLVSESSPNPTTSNPKRHNRRRSNKPFSLEESPLDTMADQRTMAELLRAPTEGYAEAIVVPPILAEHFELKHSLINMMTSDQFFGLEKDNPHDHIRWFNKITSTIKYKDVPNSAIKLMLFPFSLAGAARRWLEKEPPRSILTWEDLVSKFINEFFPPSRTTNLRNEISNFQQRFDESFHEAWDRYKDLLRACPHHGFTELHQLDTFYNALNPTDQDSLNSAAGGNLLERRTQDVLTIIENKSKVRNSRNKSIVSQVKSSDVNSSSSSEIAKLTHAVNQQTSAVTTAMTAILKQFQATPPPASVKAVEEICVTCGGAHPYYQCLAADGNTFPAYYQCLAADGNTFPEFRDNIQVSQFQKPRIVSWQHHCYPKVKLKASPPRIGLVNLMTLTFVCLPLHSLIRLGSYTVSRGDLTEPCTSLEIEILLNQDPAKEMDFNYMRIRYHDRSDNDDVYDDPFDSKEDKIKESKLLIDELDPPRSSDFLPSPKCDSILINNVKKISISNASLILEDFNPPLYELPFHKEVLGLKLYSHFHPKMRKKFSTPGFSLLKEFILFFSRNYLTGTLKLSKFINIILKARCRIFPALYGEYIRV